MQLYRAEPVAGYQWLHGARGGRMVHVGAVDAPVALDDVQKVVDEFVSVAGSGANAPTTRGVDILGWDFGLEVDTETREIARSAGIDVRLLRIPREVMDKKAVDAGDIRFFELAALSVEPKVNRRKRGVELALEDFTIPLSDIPENARGKITHWSQWIDYWAVDWDYRDDTFNNQWQSYRTGRDGQLDLTARHDYERRGTHTIVVKVIDILGNDTTRRLEVKAMTTLLSDALIADNPIATCAPAVASAVREWREAGYPGATRTTQRLLSWWFDTDREIDGRPFAFYDAQREAVESLIYVYEVMGLRNNPALLQALLPNPNVRLLQYGDFARYGVKMATGSGKTMVMALSVVWSYLNAINEPECREYATSFLIVAPNVIVFERLQGDFAGGAVFGRYRMVPPEYGDEWGEIRFFMRGDRADIASRGALYLTNIQQLHDARRSPKTGKNAPPAPIANLLGPAASDSPDERDDFDDRIVRRRAPIMVVNDEAHHTHDERSAWNSTIRQLRERMGEKRFMAQLDFSATPRFDDGTLFPWTIYDYPLKKAIEDGIVKKPIRGEVVGAGETASSDATVRYEAYITAAVRRWREYRDQLKPLNKRPVLFAMLERGADANGVGDYLQ